MACGQECGAVTPAQAHCSACHRTFGGVSGFDRHRRGGVCLDPEGLGMTLKGSVWRTAMDAEALNRLGGTSVYPSEFQGLKNER